MTQVTITNIQQEPKLVKITEAEVGKWYKIHSYELTSQFNGQIGILTHIYVKYQNGPVNQLVDTDGMTYSNESFILQELTSVEISYN